MSAKEPNRHGRPSNESPTIAVLWRIAEIEGLDPATLQPPLHDVVDADAIETLVGSGRSDAEITFTYRGHEVTVVADGTVSVTEGKRTPRR